MNVRLGAEQLEIYRSDGFLILESYFPADLMEELLVIARADRAFIENAATKEDSEGRASRLRLRYDLPRDVYAALTRSRGIVEPMEQLIGSEVYHYHHKMMLKEPRVGGAWEWHQDFGYWYAHFLYPDLASCMIAIDRATRQNGCLQVLRGSHRMGRIDHGQTGTQTGADVERVEAALLEMELVHCELQPGDVLFFHCNLLHRSDPNTSDDPRWSLICCYSAAHNPPFRDDVPGHYARLDPLDEAQVREMSSDHWRLVVGG